MSLESVFRLSLIMNMIDNLTGPMAGVTSSVNGTVSKDVYKRQALEDGNTLSEFRSRMNEFLTSEGYEGLDPLQADLIFRTNIQTAYNLSLIHIYRRGFDFAENPVAAALAGSSVSVPIETFPSATRVRNLIAALYRLR